LNPLIPFLGAPVASDTSSGKVANNALHSDRIRKLRREF